MKKTIVPNDFRDFLSILSFIGFIGIFLTFTFRVNWISDNMTALFLIIGGSSFMVLGKIFTIKKWVSDGIQQNEISQLISMVFGVSAIIIGLFLILNINIPENLFGYIGILALVPAIYTFIDYLSKNKK